MVSEEILKGLLEISEVCDGKHKIQLLTLVREFPNCNVCELIRKIYPKEQALNKSSEFYKHMKTLRRTGMVAGTSKYVITEKGNKFLTMLETVANTPAKEPVITFNYAW